jgi:hypothetical protein
MTKQMRVVALLTTIAVIAIGGTALGASVKLGPVKGASYAGVVHDETITIKVAANGKTAKVSLPGAPAFCQGGSGPEKQSSKAAKVSKGGSLTAKISYSSTTGASHSVFATVTVKGNFDTFAGSKPVFDGTVKTSFRAAGSESCNGQESFQATKL